MAKKYRGELSSDADRDLDQLSDWISERSASIRVALGYIDRIRTYLTSFQDFPHRGTKRDDLRAGLRLIGFERRVTIAFSVEGDTVVIVRIFYAGRDVDVLASEE